MEEISQRLKNTEGRIGATTDLAVLQRLYTFEKFLKKLTTQWDAHNLFIARMIQRFSTLDGAYWNGALKGYQLEQESRNLKAEVEGLKIRCGIIQDGLRSAVNRSRENAVDMDMITNRYNREQHEHR